MDATSLQLLFKAFDLTLEAADYGLPESPSPSAPHPTPIPNDSPPVVPSADTPETPNRIPDLILECPKGVPFQVPPLPYYFVKRPEHQNAVKQILLDQAPNQYPSQYKTLVVSAIYGLGGIGKSILAIALARDPQVLAQFSDGVLWATLGQQPDILAFLSHWIQALGDHSYQPITPAAASAHLRTLLADKRMLLVVDDVWNPAHAEFFRVGSPDCCVLITTREARIPQVRRYPLDVMSPDQALTLITRKLSTALTPSAQQQALAFAERIGYLPLALELTASQIEEGITWSDLWEDFQAEVAHLETLDFYSEADIPDDTKRRRFSLIACFRLSLKQLSPEQLQQFAWLGVIPEDVTLTQDMAMTLWQVSQRVAGAILRTFSAKALLLQGTQQCDQRPTYRMHDLMHDLAQNLMVNPQKPSHSNDLPGLGLTKPQAHSILIAHYRRKTEQGQWHTLPDDGYIHAHLTWHLQQAEQVEQIHQLLQETTPAGRNGWYEACTALGKTANFVTDVARAWQLATELFEQSPGEAIALQCRYGLIKASLNSLANNFPPELIGVLVQTGAWSPAQGLAHIQRIAFPWHKWKSLEEIIPHLPDSLLEEAYQVSKGIQDKNLQALAQVYLSTRMGGLRAAARETAEAFSDRYLKTLAYWQLASQEPDLWDKVIELLLLIQNENQRAWMLKEIADDLPDCQLDKVLEIAEKIKDPHDLAIVIGALYIKHPGRTKGIEKSLIGARKIEDTYRRATALGALSTIFPELWPEVIGLIKQISHERAQADTVADITPYIPEFLLDQIIDIVRSFESEGCKASTLGRLSKQRPILWKEALEFTKLIEDIGSQIAAISHLAVEAKDLWPLIDKTVPQINKTYDRTVALCALASRNSELWSQALQSARGIRDVWNRALAFRQFPSEIPELWPEVLETVQSIQGAFYQIRVLQYLTSVMPELWPITLDAISRLWIEAHQSNFLYRLSDKMPESQVDNAIEIAKNIQDRSECILALSAFIKAEPNVFKGIKDPSNHLNFPSGEKYYSVLVLGGHALKSPELWPEVMTAIETIMADEQRSFAIRFIASKIPEKFIGKALAISLCIEGDFYRARALYELLLYVDINTLDYSQWCEILSTLSCLEREELLERLPLFTQKIMDLGGKEALVGVAHAIYEVGQQWP